MKADISTLHKADKRTKTPLSARKPLGGRSRITSEACKLGDLMSIPIHPDLESKIRSQAEAQGLSIETYLERLVRADQQGTEELEILALEGLNSGAPINPGPSYWRSEERRVGNE